MQLKVTIQLAKFKKIEAGFQAEDIQEVIRMAGGLLDFSGECGLCQSDKITLQTRVTKQGSYKYTEYVCGDCRAKQQWGAYRDGGGFFLKQWEKYEPKQQQESAQVEPKYGKLEPDDDVPF